MIFLLCTLYVCVWIYGKIGGLSLLEQSLRKCFEWPLKHPLHINLLILLGAELATTSPKEVKCVNCIQGIIIILIILKTNHFWSQSPVSFCCNLKTEIMIFFFLEVQLGMFHPSIDVRECHRPRPLWLYHFTEMGRGTDENLFQVCFWKK